MKFTPTWYKNPNLSDVPSFQELEDITGMAYDNEGYYIGPKEKPKMQLVMDQRTNRQYWSPEEYDEDAIKYGAALLEREFNSKEWWGMVNDPLLSMGEKVSVASVELVKQSTKLLAKAPTEIVAGVTGMTDAVGIDAGNLAESVFANLNPVAYFGSQVARKGIKATAQDYVDLLKNIKTPKGEMGETAALYRASAKNWEATLDKWLPDVDDNIKAHSTLVTVGSMAGQIGGSLVLAAATSYVGGLPAVAGVFGSQQFYNLREEYLSKGYSLQSANIYAGVGAIFEGGLEALGFNLWLKYATLKPSLRNHLIDGLMESSQEMLQTGAEAALTNFSGVREETLVEVLAQIAIAGVAGFIPGAGISMVSGGIGIRTEKAQYELDKAIEQSPKPVQPTTKEGQYIKGPNAKQELELAKANKGSNPVYEFVRNLAVANGIKGEEQIDALFYFARNQQAQGIVGEELLQGLGKQIVAYNKQLALPDKTADKENKKAAEDITYHLSEESANKFRENTKSAAEKSGLSREEAERVADSETKIYTHLSQEFGEDVMGVKQVEYVVPSREEAKAPTVDEALAEAQAIDGQIAELKKIEGTQNQIAQLEQEKGKILSRGYIDMSGTINKIVLGNFSDVTTIKHELMHHWQYIIKTLAAKGNKKAQALQKQIDKIIAENKDYVKQDADNGAEVLTEAYELWLHTGVVADSEQQGLFDALKRFFQSVYSSAKDITGIRMNGEIDYLFRQMTGLAPIDMRGEVSNQKQQDASDVMFQEGDSIFNRTDKRKYMTDNEVKAANEDYQAFKEKFASLQEGKMPSADSFTLSRSLPSAYNKIPELKRKRMVMSQSVFKKIINLKNKYGKNHNLDYKRAEKLPLYIADPLYITRSKAEGHEDRFVIITASRGVGDGVRLSVAVQPGKNVVVVSAYDEVVNISEEKKSNRLVYSKKDELLKTNATSKAAPISNSNKSIANQTGIVKTQNTLFQTIKAQQTGAKAADEKPSKEQIAKDLDIIKRNGVEKYEKKSGMWNQIGEIAQGLILSVRQRAGAIDPKLKAFFDKLDYFQPALEKKFADQTKGWFKKYHDLSEEDKNEFDYYVYNQLHEELDIFLKEKNMTKEYQDVRNLLNFIYSISNQAGIDMGFISEYFPTSMIDHEGFMNHMKGTEKWTYIEKSLKEADPQGLWDSKQRAEAVNKLLRGYKLTDPVSKPKNAKERTILYKSPELMKFYEHSDKALMKYLQGMSRAIAINKAYGKGAGFDTDATIGSIVLDLIEGGHITRAEEDTVRHLLKSRLSYSATPEVFGIIKNLGYLSMMNNITSAITQLGDLYAPFYKYSFPTAMEAIFGKKELTRKDLGLDKIWEEFSNEEWHGIAVDKLFKAVGLDMMDAFGKKVSIQASLLNLRKQAEKGDVELLNRLSYTFGKDSAKVLADIKSGKVTEEVKILVFCDLADTQPIGKSGVPTGYLNNPRGRLFYQLKTFMLNQMSLFYADSMVNIQKGIKHKNKAQFLKGVQNGFKLVLLLTAGNATADVLKNLIMGREIDLEDTVVSNLLWNIGISKYTFYKGQREGYGWALFTSYIMPPQIGTADDVQRDAKKMAQGKQELKDSMLWTFVPFGRMYYWWFGGASEEGKNRKKKLTKKVNARNRIKNKNKRREK